MLTPVVVIAGALHDSCYPTHNVSANETAADYASLAIVDDPTSEKEGDTQT